MGFGMFKKLKPTVLSNVVLNQWFARKVSAAGGGELQKCKFRMVDLAVVPESD
jgi:hypothetical protein